MLFNTYLHRSQPEADAGITAEATSRWKEKTTVHCPPLDRFEYNWNGPLMGLAFQFQYCVLGRFMVPQSDPGVFQQHPRR
jgi:hypothetical protein